MLQLWTLYVSRKPGAHRLLGSALCDSLHADLALQFLPPEQPPPATEDGVEGTGEGRVVGLQEESHNGRAAAEESSSQIALNFDVEILPYFLLSKLCLSFPFSLSFFLSKAQRKKMHNWCIFGRKYQKIFQEMQV